MWVTPTAPPAMRVYFNDCHFSGQRFVCITWLSEDEWKSSARVQEMQSAYRQRARRNAFRRCDVRQQSRSCARWSQSLTHSPNSNRLCWVCLQWPPSTSRGDSADFALHPAALKKSPWKLCDKDNESSSPRRWYSRTFRMILFMGAVFGAQRVAHSPIRLVPSLLPLLASLAFLPNRQPMRPADYVAHLALPWRRA